MAEEAGVDLVEIAPTAQAAGLPDHGLRQVQVPGSRSALHEAEAEAEAGAGQGSQAAPGYRRERLPDQAAQHDALPGGRRQGQGDPALPRARNGAPGVRHAPAGTDQGGSRGQLVPVEQMPKMEGRQMVMVIWARPKKASSNGNGFCLSGYASGQHKCFRVNKRSRRKPPDGMSYKEHYNAQDEDQERRQEALLGSRSGCIKRGQAFKRHILTKKTTKSKRHLRGATAVNDSRRSHPSAP